MASINDTTTYPNTTPAITDHLPGTDVSDTGNSANGETVTFLLSAIWTLLRGTSGQLTAGFTAAVDDDGTQSTGTYTPAPATGNYKKIVNGGAFTLAPPSPANDEAVSLNLFITNNATAGAVTTSGFTQVSGDSFTTTDGHDFLCRIEVYDIGGTEYSLLQVVAMQ